MFNITWTPGIKLAEIEKEIILKAYKFCSDNKTTTARMLGLDIKTLRAKIEKYDKEKEEEIKRDELRRKLNEDFQRKSRGLPPIHFPEIKKSDGNKTNEGVCMESSSNYREKQSVPLQERKEIQEVLPETTSESSNGRKRCIL